MNYSSLLAPIRIRNHVLKNRMMAANALPHFLQGPETYPSDPVISYYANVAKNGAAIVTVSNRVQRNGTKGDKAHMPMYDFAHDPTVDNYISQLAANIHFYGSLAAVAILQKAPEGWGVVTSDGPASDSPWMGGGPKKEMTEEQMEAVLSELVSQVQYYQTMGFDMVSLHMSYQTTIFAHFLSPITNTRTDRYGGSLENRARFPLEACRRIREACGEDFLIEVQISGDEAEGGFTVEDLVAFAKLAEGTVDILQLRAADVDLAHPTGFNSVPHQPVTLQYAKIIKNSGVKILAAPCGGYQDLEDSNRWIAEGSCDMVAMARAFICDPDYGQKAMEGRGEDVVPCIRCDRCHGISRTGPWLSVCSVNPRLGLEHRLERMIFAPKKQKKVAVIGGGPAGMKAALVAADRGHLVTLYEKNSYLGGQLHHADFSKFKWPIRDYKDYLIGQLEKSGVQVRLQTEAVPQMIRDAGYDAVLMANGAEPNLPAIPGAEKAWLPTEVYGREQELGKRVVVVGGSEIGMETGMYLGETGHSVTVLTRQRQLAPNATPVHYMESVRTAWEALEDFRFIPFAKTVEITASGVTYLDREGTAHTLACDSVVVAGGMNACQSAAMQFAGTAPEFYVIGDCAKVGNIQTATRSAYSIASIL